MKKSIAIDMDGVLADVEAQFLAWYERDYRVRMTKADLQGSGNCILLYNEFG